MHPVSIRWKAVFSLIGLVLAVLLCLHLVGGPSIIHPMRMIAHRRHLMNDDSCSHLDQQIKYLETLVKVNERKNTDTLERLRTQNADLRRKLDVQRELVKELERRNRQLMDKMSNVDTGRPSGKKDDYRLAPQVRPDTIRTLNIRQNSEFEVIPYTSFSRDRLYQLDSGMLNKPELPANGDKKQDFDEMMDTALSILNENADSESYQYTVYDLLQGYWRTNKQIGSQYELYFHSKGRRHIYDHIQLFRPFAPIQKVQVQTYDKRNEWINVIVPLSGRVDTFKQFMEMFVEQGIKKDQKVFLTLVYFGDDGLQEVKEILASISEQHQFTNYKVIERAEDFSRGVGLFAGAESWDKGNVLLFFCDVDIFFKDGFLDRCRLNAVPATRVYYPIVFSLYNPSIVYGSKKEEIPYWRDQLVLSRESGFWRTFGFGMTCMYRSDFLFMRGFDTRIQGWGYEDVKLYRKLVQSNIDIVRSPDPGIFHLWHEKQCDPHLPPVQYNMCLGSKAIGEASHAQLGMLAFRELKEENERLHETVDEGDVDPEANLEQINDMFDNMDTAL